jgi:tellurite resistance protein TehA-like permease
MSSRTVTLDTVAFVRGGVTRLPTSAFAFVMATGIVSIATLHAGLTSVSIWLGWLSLAALVAVCAATAWQLKTAPGTVVQRARDASQAFGYLTVVAAFNVVAARMFGFGFTSLTWSLAIIAFVLWLGLGYGIPALLFLGRSERSALPSVDGGWFLWAVATQSVAVVAGGLSGTLRPLAVVAAVFWAIGVMLYVVLTTLVTLHLLVTSALPGRLNPSYWIYMGATAITVSSGSAILAIASPGPLITDFRPVIAGFTFILWAFGLWWIPLLVLFGIWRHSVHRVPLRYDTSLWSIVFPLGMLAASSIEFGSVENLAFIVWLGRVGAFIALASWIAVAFAGVHAATRAWRRALV